MTKHKFKRFADKPDIGRYPESNIRPALKVWTSDREDTNLMRKRVGKFTVIGLSANVAARWIVKCDCGMYALRRARAIINPENTLDRCQKCEHLRNTDRRDHFKDVGEWPDNG